MAALSPPRAGARQRARDGPVGSKPAARRSGPPVILPNLSSFLRDRLHRQAAGGRRHPDAPAPARQKQVGQRVLQLLAEGAAQGPRPVRLVEAPAGQEGGRLVAAGTPEEIAAHPDSVTGRFLR